MVLLYFTIYKKGVVAGERLGDVTLIAKRGPRITCETPIATSSVSLGPMIAYPRSCLMNRLRLRWDSRVVNRTQFEC